jgi:hypothetical protein
LIGNGNELVYRWFDVMKADGYYTIAYAIMPNHVHVILYFPRTGFDLNKIIGNAKRFMAYEIIDRLEQIGRKDILDYLRESISERERKKGQLHKVFTDSFEKIRAIRFPVVIAVENIGVGGQTPLRHPPIVVVKGIPR